MKHQKRTRSFAEIHADDEITCKTTSLSRSDRAKSKVQMQPKTSNLSKERTESKIIASQILSPQEQRCSSRKKCLVWRADKGMYALLTWQKTLKRYPSLAPPDKTLFGKEHRIYADKIRKHAGKNGKFENEVRIITTLLYPSKPHKFLVLYEIKDKRLRKRLKLPGVLLGAKAMFQGPASDVIMEKLQLDTPEARRCWTKWNTKKRV
jgi:hypothetical protein